VTRLAYVVDRLAGLVVHPDISPCAARGIRKPTLSGCPSGVGPDVWEARMPGRSNARNRPACPSCLPHSAIPALGWLSSSEGPPWSPSHTGHRQTGLRAALTAGAGPG